MARRRTNRPVEELRSTWNSTADLEETIAAMFPQRVPEHSPALPPSKPTDFKNLTPEATVAAESATTVSLDPTTTVADESTDTVSVEPADTVAADSATTVADESTDTVAAGPADTVSLEPTATVAVEPTRPPSDTVAVESATTVSVEPAATVVVGPRDTVAVEIPLNLATENLARVPSTETVSVEPADTVSVGKRLGGLWVTEGPASFFPASRVRRISIAQDALTHAEEAVYDTLWGPKNQSRDSFRLTGLSYNAIAKAARVTKMNAKWIVERLIHKGFVKIEVLPDPLRRIPTKYCVYSYRAALDNMFRSNRQFVIRTGNGVLFAHPVEPADTVSVEATATVSVGPAATVSADSAATAPPGQSATVAPGQSATVSPADTPLGSTSEALSTSNVVASSIIREFGFVDDDALKLLIRKCRENAPDAADEEIADLGAMTARRISRMRDISNPVGLLIQQTAKCFVGEPFAMYRKSREEQEQRIKRLYEEGDDMN